MSEFQQAQPDKKDKDGNLIPVGKRISQDTFDDTVAENIEDFDMSHTDAVKDAITQFEGQGVNLDNIFIQEPGEAEIQLDQLKYYLNILQKCTSEDIEEHEVIKAMQYFQEALASKLSKRELEEEEEDIERDEEENDGKKKKKKKEEVEEEEVKKENHEHASDGTCCTSTETDKAVTTTTTTTMNKIPLKDRPEEKLKTWFGLQGGITFLGNMLGSEDLNLLKEVIQTLTIACQHNIENKDFFPKYAMGKLCAILTAHIEDDDTDLIERIICLVRVLASRQENNKVAFVAFKGIDLSLKMLHLHKENESLVFETLWAIKRITAVDDFRSDFNAAHNHVQVMVRKGAIDIVVEIAKMYPENAQVATNVLGVIKNLAINVDSVKAIVHHGGLDFTLEMLRKNMLDLKLTTTAIAVLRNISADDELKNIICKGDGSILVETAMQEHQNDPVLQQHAMATVAAMCLRSPTNSVRMVSMGIIPTILRGMGKLPNAVGTQRLACMALRNIVSRNPEFADKMLDAGAEHLLRAAGMHQGAIDEAYAALRDLNCEVKRVFVDRNTGKVAEAEQFGQVKMKFNPVYDDRPDMDNIIDENQILPSEGYNF